MFTFTHVFRDISGNPITHTALTIAPTTGFLQFNGTTWDAISDAPKSFQTNGSGLATSPALPWPSICEPVPGWILRDPLGFLWLGRIPQGITTGDLEYLLSHGWSRFHE